MSNSKLLKQSYCIKQMITKNKKRKLYEENLEEKNRRLIKRIYFQVSQTLIYNIYHHNHCTAREVKAYLQRLIIRQLALIQDIIYSQQALYMYYILYFLNLLPITFLIIYTFLNLERQINHKANLFAWIIYIVYMPMDTIMWFLLSDQVYLVIATIFKVFIVFTVTDSNEKLLSFIQSTFMPQVMLQVLRCKAVNWGYVAYLQLTRWYISFLDKQQEEVFKQNVIGFFQSKLHTPFASSNTDYVKQNEKDHKQEGIKKTQNEHSKHEQSSQQSEVEIIKSIKSPAIHKQQPQKSPRQKISKVQNPPSQILNELENIVDIKPVVSYDVKSSSLHRQRSKEKVRQIKVHYEADSNQSNPRRVPVLLQMGTKNYPRLEKYFLEMDHRELSIISTHGRVFEKHHLTSIVDLGNEYYQLVFPEAEFISSRTVMFPNGIGKLGRFIKQA